MHFSIFVSICFIQLLLTTIQKKQISSYQCLSTIKEYAMKSIVTLILLFSTLGPLFAGSNFGIGMSAYNAKKYDRARDYFQKEILANPSNGDAYYFLGEVEKTTGNYAAAEENYRKAVKSSLQRKFFSLAYWNIVVLVEQRNDIPELIIVCKEFWLKAGEDGAKRKIDGIINKLIWTDNKDAEAQYDIGINLKKFP